LGSRDGRLFLIMLGGILGKGYWSLLVIAFLTHLTVLLRILRYATAESSYDVSRGPLSIRSILKKLGKLSCFKKLLH